MKKILFTITILFIIFNISYSQNVNYPIKYKTDNTIIYSICFSLKGEILGIADNNKIKVFKTNTAELLQTFENSTSGQILSIDISKDSSLLVSGGKDSTIVIWDFITKNKIKTLNYSNGIITTLKISPDSKYIAWGGTDKIVYLYNIEKEEVISVFNEHTEVITAIDFSPDGNYIATASGDMTINIYNISQKLFVKSLIGHTNWVRDIKYSENGEILMSCGDDLRVIVWNTDNYQVVKSRKYSRFKYDWLLSIDINNDNKTYVIGNFNGKVEIFTMFGGYNKKIKSPIIKVLFKPNEGVNLKIVVATRGNGVFLIDAKNMRSKNL